MTPVTKTGTLGNSQSGNDHASVVSQLLNLKSAKDTQRETPFRTFEILKAAKKGHACLEISLQ